MLSSPPLHIFTPAWGPKHLALMTSALGRSLKWDLNYKAVRRAKWHLVSNPRDAQDLRNIAASILPDSEIDILVDPRIGNGNPGLHLAEAVMKVMQMCLDDSGPLLMATPDFVYGNGTIGSMMAIADRPGTCASMAHIRVLPDFLNSLGDGGPMVLKNSNLMWRAFHHSHSTWQDVQCGADPTMSFHCGVTWKWIGPGIAAVQHHMPSPFLINFMARDLDDWQNDGQPGFGFWDHDWPEFLIKAQRLRLIGSSDIAFMAEVTDPNANLGSMLPRNPLDPDAYFREAYHCKIQRQFVSCFRGEP